MLGLRTSKWSLKRRSDDNDAEFGEFEEDRELDEEELDDELDEDLDEEEDLDDYDELDDEFDEGEDDEFKPRKSPRREWE